MKNILFFLFCCVSVSGFSQITFQKSYGGAATDDANCIRQTFDGGFVLAGFTNSFGAGDYDMYILKTDAFGDTVWTRTFGGLNEDMGMYVIQTADSNFLLSGHAFSIGGGCLIKIDINGNIIWIKTYQGVEIFSVLELSNHEIAFTGITPRPGGADSDIWFLKTDSAGNVIETRTYGDTEYNRGLSIHQIDNGYLLYGESGNVGLYDRLAIRIDSAGNIISSKKIQNGILNYYNGRNVCPTIDKCSILFTAATGSGAVDIFKIDSLGNILWTKDYLPTGGFHSLVPFSIQQTPDSGFIITGSCDYNINQQRNTFLIKTNSEGNIQWSNIYGDTTAFNEGHFVICTSDGGYAIAGAQLFNNGISDFTLLKVDSDGHNNCFTSLPLIEYAPVIIDSIFLANASPGNFNTNTGMVSVGSGGTTFNICTLSYLPEINQTFFSIYPNPFHNQTTLTARGQFSVGSCQLKIYNTLGSLIRTEEISNLQSHQLYRNRMHDGIYFFHVIRNENSSQEIIGSGKFIID